jgi:hypothetical protein
MNINIPKKKNRWSIIFFLYWIIKIFTALFIGFGWFFLLWTLQIIFSVPQIYLPLLNIINRKKYEENSVKNNEVKEIPKLSAGMVITIIIWISLTIIAFLKANISIYSIILLYIYMK